MKNNFNRKHLKLNLRSYRKFILESSIILAPHKIPVYQKINKLINSIFTKNDKFYSNLSLTNYRKLMLEAQDLLNHNKTVNIICSAIKADLIKYLNTDSFLVQSNIYLRASRPQKSHKSESVGWHRESFYGSNMEKSVNVWTPVKGVSVKNTLRFIPCSQKIKDSEIKTFNIKSNDTKKFSDGHKLGFVYSPKIIEKGVDLRNHQPILVKKNHSAIFSGNLIHGSALNLSNKIRFSIDFRVLRKRDYKSTNKNFHITSKKPYFIEYSD